MSAQVTIPIVAASWTTWSPSLLTMDGAPAGQGLRWLARFPEGGRAVPDGFSGMWVTWYATSRRFGAPDPSTVIGTTADGQVMTAGQISGAHLPGQAPITWDNESVFADGAPFGPVRPDTTDQWMHVLYTAWQMMAQQGTARLTDTVEIPRPRAGRKRDAREGIADPGTVRIVHVHSAHRPPRAAAELDAAASTGRRAPQWSCRWPVRPHRRSHCMNPAQHADAGCTHEDRIIPPVVKGPADKPLRLRETVNLWDSQPEPEASR